MMDGLRDVYPHCFLLWFPVSPKRLGLNLFRGQHIQLLCLFTVSLAHYERSEVEHVSAFVPTLAPLLTTAKLFGLPPVAAKTNAWSAQRGCLQKGTFTFKRLFPFLFFFHTHEISIRSCSHGGPIPMPNNKHKNADKQTAFESGLTNVPTRSGWFGKIPRFGQRIGFGLFPRRMSKNHPHRARHVGTCLRLRKAE